MYVVMNTTRPIIVFALALFLSAPATAQEAKPLGTFGDWEAYREADGAKPVCYIGTAPKKAKGKYKARGETYVLITHRPAEKSFGVVSVRAGYTFKKDSEATVRIGKNRFSLFTDAGHAFAKDKKTDAALVKAMIRGAKMVIRGTSSRGTKTTDTYSLKGVSAAWKAINKACRAR
jgi:hypothetical protein